MYLVICVYGLNFLFSRSPDGLWQYCKLDQEAYGPLVSEFPESKHTNMLLFLIFSDSWHQPSLFRHDSVDSGVSKGAYAGITGNLSGWHGSSRGHDGMSQRSGGGTGNHRHWNGSFHSRKGCAFQEKPPTDIREEKKEDKVEKLQFEEEDFVSIKV